MWLARDSLTSFRLGDDRLGRRTGLTKTRLVLRQHTELVLCPGVKPRSCTDTDTVQLLKHLIDCNALVIFLPCYGALEIVGVIIIINTLHSVAYRCSNKVRRETTQHGFRETIQRWDYYALSHILFSFLLARELQAISDPYSQAPSVWVSASLRPLFGCLQDRLLLAAVRKTAVAIADRTSAVAKLAV